ncbi:MAG: hypothetical protein EON54_10800, partial [Alcaligenaceae bacterium]
GLFRVYTMGHVSEGIALLTGEASGMSPAELLEALADADGSADLRAGDAGGQATAVEATVLQRAEQTLRAYRRACQSAGHTSRGRRARGR